MEKITYEVFEKIVLLPARAYEEKSSGEFINRVTQDSTNIVSNLNSIIWLLSDLIAVLVGAYRLSTIIAADVIHFLENGKIKVSGTHEYLLNNLKEYQKLYINENV